MPLNLPTALGLLPKLISTVESAIGTIATIKALPKKDAKSIGAAVGIAPNGFVHELLDLTDDVIAAAATTAPPQ